MVAQSVLMPKKPKRDFERYRKSTRMARIRKRLAEQADLLGQRLDKKFTEVVNDALREKLEREGLWPPKDTSAG